MKKNIYISLPITGHEDTYEQRLNAAILYVLENFPEYEVIITPRAVAKKVDELFTEFGKKADYKNYLLHDLIYLATCEAIFMCHGWDKSKGCLAEHAFAEAIGLEILYLP